MDCYSLLTQKCKDKDKDVGRSAREKDKDKDAGRSGCDCHALLSASLAMTKEDAILITHHEKQNYHCETPFVPKSPFFSSSRVSTPLSLRGVKRRGSLIHFSPHLYLCFCLLPKSKNFIYCFFLIIMILFNKLTI